MVLGSQETYKANAWQNQFNRIKLLSHVLFIQIFINGIVI